MSTSINLKKVRLLRDKTSAPLLLIKEALQTCNDDTELAENYINNNWHSHEKPTGFNTIYSYAHNGRIGIMFEISCGTDFVAKTENFKKLCQEIAYQLVAGLTGDLETQDYVRDPTVTVGNIIDKVSKETGEPIKVKRYIRWEA